MAEPVVTAVVVNWNGRDGARAVSADAARVDVCRTMTVLVVDNASTDGSARARPRPVPGRRRSIESPENLGYAAGANAGFGAALDGGAEYVLLLNNDIELDADAVTCSSSTRRSSIRSARSSDPMIYYADRPDVIWSAGGACRIWTGNIRHVGLREKDTGQFDGRHARSTTSRAARCSSPLSAVERIGPMDDGLLHVQRGHGLVRPCHEARDTGAGRPRRADLAQGLDELGRRPDVVQDLPPAAEHAQVLRAATRGLYHWLGIMPADRLSDGRVRGRASWPEDEAATSERSCAACGIDDGTKEKLTVHRDRHKEMAGLHETQSSGAGRGECGRLCSCWRPPSRCRVFQRGAARRSTRASSCSASTRRTGTCSRP